MPDQYDPKQTLRSPYGRPADVRPAAPPAKDDPLAELARMVHGRGNQAAQPPRRATDEPPPAADLESELLNDLQASFAAVREAAANVTPRRQDPPAASPPVAPRAPAPPPIVAAPSPEPPRMRAVTPPEPDAPSIYAPRAPAAAPPPSRPEARTEAHPEIRPEFRLEPFDESRLVPIPPAPVIQPQVPPGYVERQAERAAAAAAAEPLPRVFERGQRELPPPQSIADAGADDFSAFQLRPSSAPAGVTPSAVAPATPSRWEKPQQPVEPPPVSRFAPPSAGVQADEGLSDEELDPFVDAGLFPPAESDEDFDADDFGLPADYPDDEEATFAEPQAPASRRARTRAPLPRGIIIAAAVVAIALVGGISVAMFRQGEKSAGAPETILADDAPTKITPDDSQTAPATDANAQNKMIYDRVNSAEANNNTTLLTPDNAPLRTAPAPDSGNAISRVILPGGPGYDTPGGSQDNGASGGASGSASSTASGATGGDDDSIGPRKVRTVVVKPDGTILSSLATNATAAPANADAGQATAPATTTAAPGTTAAAPAAQAPAPAPAANAAPLTDDTAAIAGTGGSALTITADPDAANAPAIPSPIPSDTATVAAARAPAPKPVAVQPRPVKPAVAAVASNDASAPLDLTPGANQGSQPATSADGFYVQVSSQRTEDAARATYKDLQGRYPSILGKYDVNLQQASVPSRGTFYRVRVGPFSGNDAQRLCDDLKSAGGDCVLARR